METNFNFKSQVCTSRSQSEKLLALGLKPETADMCWQTTILNGEAITYPSQDVWLNGSIITNNHFPAWSLHRLIEMVAGGSEEQMIFLPDPYDELIEEIAGAIMVGCFNKEYLV